MGVALMAMPMIWAVRVYWRDIKFAERHHLPDLLGSVGSPTEFVAGVSILSVWILLWVGFVLVKGFDIWQSIRMAPEHDPEANRTLLHFLGGLGVVAVTLWPLYDIMRVDGPFFL